MKMYKLCALVVLAGTMFSGSGQSATPSEFTHEMLNGRVWRLLKPMEKVYLLVGIGDGVTISTVFNTETEGKSSEAAHLKTQNLFHNHFNRTETSTKIDEIYSHIENLNLPVVYAYYVALTIFNGKTYAEDEGYLSSLRKTFNTSDPL